MTKKLLEAVLLPTENENFPTEKEVSFPEWSNSPHSDVSHLALTVGALLNCVDGVGVHRHGPGQVINAPLPSQLSKCVNTHANQAASLTEDTTAIALARIERLRAAHAEAVAKIEGNRKQPGQLTSGINVS